MRNNFGNILLKYILLKYFYEIFSTDLQTIIGEKFQRTGAKRSLTRSPPQPIQFIELFATAIHWKFQQLIRFQFTARHVQQQDTKSIRNTGKKNAFCYRRAKDDAPLRFSHRSALRSVGKWYAIRRKLPAEAAGRPPTFSPIFPSLHTTHTGKNT